MSLPGSPPASGSAPGPSPRHDLLRVLRAALATVPDWWSDHELRLISSYTTLPSEAADTIARLVVRTRRLARRTSLDLDDADIRLLLVSGWLQDVPPIADPEGVIACLSLAEIGHPGPRAAAEQAALGKLAALTVWGPFYALSAPAAQLIALAQLVAFAGDEDLSLLARIRAGQLTPPSGSPLAGDARPTGPLPWASRIAAEAYLTARNARRDGIEFPVALSEVQALAGTPWHCLHHHLTPAYHWTRLLWESSTSPAQRRQARRALRRAPCSPGLARSVWEDLHAAWAPRPAADRLATQFAEWSLWNEVERAAWAARAAGTRVVRPQVWHVRTLAAWLDSDGTQVVAEGERVEALALRRMASEGWQGIHAEGSFWLAAAYHLLDGDPCPTVPWCAPLQSAPLDWGRWGYGARRRTAIATRSAQLLRDPATALARPPVPPPGFLPTPDPEALAAMVRLLPPRVLVGILRRVLDTPGEAAGLPDLVLWKDDAVAFWEVKSPNDQLSAQQRRWLTWLVSEGVTAGVLRVRAKQPQQTRLFPAQPKPASAARPRPAGRSRAHDHGDFALLLDDAPWHPIAGEPSPLDLPAAPHPWQDVRDELPFVDDRLIAVAASAVLIERREGRRTVLRRWFPVPAGLVLVGAVRDAALPGGGVVPCLRLLTRAAGWLVPADLARCEPVVATPDELADPTRDWVPHPATEPPRAESRAAAWGCAQELADQLQLIGSQPHGVWLAAEHLVIALPAQQQVLWTVHSPRIVAGVLPVE